MQWRMWDAAIPKRVAILVSRQDHCLLDLLWRRRRGRLAMDVVLVVSNHPDLREDVESFGLPFVHVPVEPGAQARGRAAPAGAAARRSASTSSCSRATCRSSAASCSTRSTPRDQHPPLLPAGVRRREPLRAGQAARRQADRRDRALRHRGARRGADHRAGHRARDPPRRRRRADGASAPTSSARCSRVPCSGTAKTACCARARRPSCSERACAGDTGLYFSHPSSLEHDPRALMPGHPDTPARLVAIERLLGAEDWLGWQRRAAPAAPERWLELVHEPAQIAQVERLAEAGGGAVDLDTVVGEASYRAALHAAGGACEMVGALLAGEARLGFSAMRPPGHHAEPDRAMGFCLFNSAAIAAALAIAELGARARADPRLGRAPRQRHRGGVSHSAPTCSTRASTSKASTRAPARCATPARAPARATR